MVRLRSFIFKWSDVQCSDVKWTDVIYVKRFYFEVQWSEVQWVTEKFLGIKGWPYSEGTWLYCDCFIWVYLVLSFQSSSINPFSSISPLISSAQVSLGLPRFLLPGGLHFKTFFGSLPSSIRWTCPYHLSWLVLISSKRDLVTFIFCCYADILPLIVAVRTSSTFVTKAAIYQQQQSVPSIDIGTANGLWFLGEEPNSVFTGRSYTIRVPCTASSVRPVHSSERFLAIWTPLLSRKAVHCTYRHTRHSVTVHRRLRVSASKLLEHRLCSAEQSVFECSALCFSSASPVLYCSDIQTAQVVTVPVWTLLYAHKVRKKRLEISTVANTVKKGRPFPGHELWVFKRGDEWTYESKHVAEGTKEVAKVSELNVRFMFTDTQNTRPRVTVNVTEQH